MRVAAPVRRGRTLPGSKRGRPGAQRRLRGRPPQQGARPYGKPWQRSPLSLATLLRATPRSTRERAGADCKRYGARRASVARTVATRAQTLPVTLAPRATRPRGDVQGARSADTIAAMHGGVGSQIERKPGVPQPAKAWEYGLRYANGPAGTTCSKHASAAARTKQKLPCRPRNGARITLPPA